MMLAVGSQRSYSDVCRLTGGEIVKAGDRMLEFDHVNGVIRAEAGITLRQILKFIRPFGWFFHVTPGTSHATLGGCIANDVHGKNHTTAGSFGNHVLAMNLTPETAIGGLGLTGKIEWAEIKLKHQPIVFMPYYYPLDYIPWYWQKYQRMGCWQFQCVVPNWRQANRLLRWAYQRPFLIVRKEFGDIPSRGMLSFPRPGVSVSMDFARPDAVTQKNLCAAAIDAGGAIYPAKTSMSKLAFQYSFPKWQEFSKFVDPEFSSDFWRRVS